VGNHTHANPDAPALPYRAKAMRTVPRLTLPIPTIANRCIPVPTVPCHTASAVACLSLPYLAVAYHSSPSLPHLALP